MPVFEYKSPVYHVGNLDEDRDPPRYSYEGTGLSVSEHPDAWRTIARDVTGDTYELSNPDSEFYVLDPLELPVNEHINWCVDTDFITETTGYHVETPNGFVQFYDHDEAKQEADAYDTVPHERTLYALGDRGRRYWEHAFTSSPDSADPLGVEALLPVWFGQFALDVDGVWWNNTLAPHDYSAPKGVIFQSQLQNWETEIVE